MLRSILVATCLLAGCSKPAPSPSTPTGATLAAGPRDLAGAAQRFRTALGAHKVDGLLAAQVLIENGNAERGCPEASEPCAKATVSAAEAASQLVQLVDGFTFGGPEGAAKDLGCDATCCRYGTFVHGDHRRAISKVCFDDAAEPTITTIVAD